MIIIAEVSHPSLKRWSIQRGFRQNQRKIYFINSPRDLQLQLAKWGRWIIHDFDTYFGGSRLGGFLDLQGLLGRGEARSKKMVYLFSDFQSVRNSRNPIFVAQQEEIGRDKRGQSP